MNMADSPKVETADAQRAPEDTSANATPSALVAGPTPVDPRTAAADTATAAGNTTAAEKVEPSEVQIPGVAPDGAAPTAAYGTHVDDDSPRPLGIVAPEHQAARENADKALPPEGEVRPATTTADKSKPV